MGLPFAKFGFETKNLAKRQPHVCSVYFKVLADEHLIAVITQEIALFNQFEFPPKPVTLPPPPLTDLL
jgi:hypothetical protein